MSLLFENYRSSSPYDEMIQKDGTLRPYWKQLVKNLEKIGAQQLVGKQKEIDWRLEDNGVTYNVYNDPSGLNRPWKLDPIPLLIEQDEWIGIEAGLKQRCRLLSALLQDIYGEQRCIRDEIIPMEVIYAHSGFMREVYSMPTSLTLYAADMARGPDGKMWIINDRTQAPSGLGYAIENRLTMNAAMDEAFEGVSIRRLSGFFERLKDVIKGPKGEGSLNVLLTPGPHNETYFEHAYLSSFLGLTLVQGQDLMAKNGSLWLKSLNGLRRIDSVMRRVDEVYCDPLELRSDSYLGVAGLVQVIRNDGVRMINPLGSGILENLGLSPFMERLARYFLNEELILPQIATWWCGQEKEREFVLDNLERLIIKTIDRNESKHTFIGRSLNPAELEELRRKIIEKPHRYVGQEEIAFATCPTLVKESIEQGHAIIRAYTLSTEEELSVMPGGLVRIGNGNDLFSVSNQFGGSSKDLWILGASDPIPFGSYVPSNSLSADSFETMPSLRAENLFWQGRYLMRAILTARKIRTTLKYLSNATRYEQGNTRHVRDILTKALTHVTMTYPGFMEEIPPSLIYSEVYSVMSNPVRAGSFAQTLAMLSHTNTQTKNLLPLEAWRIFERMSREWKGFCREEKPIPHYMIHMLDKMLTHLMAYKELIQESLFVDQGSVLYEIGSRIERSQLLIAKARSLLIHVYDPIDEHEILESLLGTCESLNAYRARYRSSFELRNVAEFLLFDIRFPKSLIAEIEGLLKLLSQLPKSKNTTYLSRYEEPIFEAFSILRLTKPESVCTLEEGKYVRRKLDTLLNDLSDRLILSSNEISKTYFAHNDE